MSADAINGWGNGYTPYSSRGEGGFGFTREDYSDGLSTEQLARAREEPRVGVGLLYTPGGEVKPAPAHRVDISA